MQKTGPAWQNFGPVGPFLATEFHGPSRTGWADGPPGPRRHLLYKYDIKCLKLGGVLVVSIISVLVLVVK